MKTSWICLFLVPLLFSSVCFSVDHGNCDTYHYAKKLRTCQAIFFEKLGNTANRTADCPKFYHEAVECVNQTVITDCYEGKEEEFVSKVRMEELQMFGNETFYCTFGGIEPILPFFLSLNATVCQTKENVTTVKKCEDPFYNEFEKNATSDKLCGLAAHTLECQSKILSSCGSQNPAVYGRGQYPVLSSGGDDNVHCHHVRASLNPHGRKATTERHHRTAWDVLTPIIVIAVLILLALIVGFCYFAKKEARNTAKENKQNKDKISEKAQQHKQKNADQPAQEGEELLPLSNVVVLEKEDISTV